MHSTQTAIQIARRGWGGETYQFPIQLLQTAYLEMRFNLRALLLVLLPRQYRNVAYNKIIINGLIGSATTASGGRQYPTTGFS